MPPQLSSWWWVSRAHTVQNHAESVFTMQPWVTKVWETRRLKLAPVHKRNWSKVLVTQTLVHEFNPQNPILKNGHDVTYILIIPALERWRQVNFWDCWLAGIAYEGAPGQYIFIIHTYMCISLYIFMCVYVCNIYMDASLACMFVLHLFA